MSKSNLRRRLGCLTLGLLLLIGIPVTILSSYWPLIFPDVAFLATDNPSTTALMEARLEGARRQGRPYQREWSWVPLSAMSPHLQKAVIMAEDASFYSHDGFDWEGIRDALVRNVGARRLHRGGSTITQQLAKNLYLSSDKTLWRKAREALITLALERHLTKTRILELYLNVAEWGQGVYGAEAAARHHFAKSAMELSPEEAALLAAILPSPRAYDQLRMTRYLSVRQQQILRWMKRGSREVPGFLEPSLELPLETPIEPPVEPSIDAPGEPSQEAPEQPPAEPPQEPPDEPVPEPFMEPPGEQPENRGTEGKRSP
jgi:monofunctional biosynthetic peptidoglycan transglycosylase